MAQRLKALARSFAVLMVALGVLFTVGVVVPILLNIGRSPAIAGQAGFVAEWFSADEAPGEDAEPSDRPALEENEAVAKALTLQGDITVNGAALTDEQALLIASNTQDYNARVEFLDQYEHLASGCEIIALAVVLRAEGYGATPQDLAENYVRYGDNLATDFQGTPWELYGGGGFPPCIVDAANGYLAAQGGGAFAYDLTGTTFNGLLALVRCGYPVVTWTTEDMVQPEFYGLVMDGVQWYFPAHCVVVYGMEGDDVLVCDSIAGVVRRNCADFAAIYDACGSRCMFVQAG